MNLAEKYRPAQFTEMVGLDTIVGPNGVLTKMVANHNIRSCIFYGPPGCGKTTAANILAEQSGMTFYKLNATNSSIKDIQSIAQKGGGLLYLDEIQYFNKKQQQSLLPYIESGEITLIGATTDNPYYCCYKALLSRCCILEFTPVSAADIRKKLADICRSEPIDATEDAITMIANESAGDVRRAINMLDLAVSTYGASATITKQHITDLLPSTRMSGFDTDDDIHYALVSCLQKSIRGSDPNAAVFYLAKLLEGGDILSPCRRLMVIAAEDIGLAQPNAIPFVYACCESAKQLGMPEAMQPLANAVIYLAISPKCCSAGTAYNKAKEAVQQGKGAVIPKHLRHAHTKEYVWPHAYPYHWYPQQYLPDDAINDIYYQPGDNPFETNAANYWATVKKNYPYHLYPKI